jgi:predicted lipid-binding transport protein (Tim44 family)
MKKFSLALLVMASVLSLTVSEADARRMGGGGSFGKQSQSLSRPPAPAPGQSAIPAKSAAPPAAAPQTPPPRPASPWRGILGGALLGLGLGALMSHFGLGGAFGSFLMIALLAIAVMFIIRMFRRKSDGNNVSAYAARYPSVSTPEIGSRIETAAAQPVALQFAPVAAASNVAPFGVPADFDVPAFVRNAKIYFIRLQAAWDKADINDIREFTTPEMFAELRMQIQERGASPNNTDTVTLNAELMGIETHENDYLASVKFSGMIKEADNAPAEPFTEVWNLSKPTSGQGGWVLAGIQQLP